MGMIYTYAGIGFLLVGVILLIADAATIKKRREKKKAEIENDFG